MRNELTDDEKNILAEMAADATEEFTEEEIEAAEEEARAAFYAEID